MRGADGARTSGGATLMANPTAVLLFAVCVTAPWYDYCWDAPDPRIRLADWPVLVADCWLGPDMTPPPGCAARFDYNDDGTVDLRDVCIHQADAQDWSVQPLMFNACFQGPDVTVVADCQRWDLDGDDNVDLVDAMLYFQCVTNSIRSGQ